MNTKYVLTASLAGGLISLILANAPYVELINLALCAGFWIGPVVAVLLYSRLDGTMTMRQAVVVGVLSGLWHGLFGLVLSPLGLAGAGSLLNAARPFISAQDLPAIEGTLTGVGGILFNLVGVAVDVTFGFIGGVIGVAIFRPRPRVAA